MSDARSIAVQSVLYGNAAADVVRAARAVAHSMRLASDAGLVSDWTYRVGDCSPAPALGADDLTHIVELVEASGGAVDHVMFGENLGSAGGHNSLAARGSSDLMLILNPDAMVAPDALTALCHTLSDGVGIAEARQVPIEHPKDYDAATGDTSWASTACALTQRKAFDEVGGFDADTFFLYCDDVDYSWRVKLAGYRVLFTPSATVFHDKRLGLDGSWIASIAERYYSAEAALLLPLKYSRADIAKNVKARLLESDDPEAARAVLEVERREKAGLLASPIDRNRNVGQFVGPNYARHRFQ